MRRRPVGLDRGAKRGRRWGTAPRLEALEDRQLLAVLVVNTTNDSGAGSLRQAILDANAMSGTDIIDFNIAGTGVQTITPVTPLPTITDAVTIDGTTQQGYTTVPLIELSGAAAGAGLDGLTFNAAQITVRALAIDHWGGSGVRITGAGGDTLQSNYIGVNPTGAAAAANGLSGVTIENAPRNTIGGVSSTLRNVISGNLVDGVAIQGAGASGNLVQGNFIGTDATGSTAIGNGTAGVAISDFAGSPGVGAASNTIGGTIATAQNVISGQGVGVMVTAAGSSGNLIEGNFIGTNASGTAAISNGIGVEFGTGATQNTIGGTTTATRNLISGNTRNGILFNGSNANLVEGNFIGTNAGGTAALGNGFQGAGAVLFDLGSSSNTIGGTTSTAGNVISGNAGNGVWIEQSVNTASNFAISNIVEGNLIGTNAAGNAAIANAGNGVVLGPGATANSIGATIPAARNVISGNKANGIVITGANSNGNQVVNNLVGTAQDGTTALGNLANGILIANSASNNTIGGVITGSSNTSAFNGGAGVFVDSGTGNSIRQDSTFSNIGLGIDLAPKGVNPNLASPSTTGPNLLQNYPIISSVSTTGTTTTVTGNLTGSKPSTAYTLDFYSNPGGPTTGNGPGKSFLGSTNVTTDATGKASFTFTPSTSVPNGTPIAATATDPLGNTSEFSPVAVSAPPTTDLNLFMFAQPEPVAVNGNLTYTIIVGNGGPSQATNVTVTNTLPGNVTFVAGTAQQGSISQSGTTVTANLGTLPPGGTATITLTTVPTATGSIKDTATVNATETDSNPANNSGSATSTVVQGADLGVTSTVTPSPAIVGMPVNFQLVVTNNTNSVANGVVLTDNVPTNATYITSSTTQGTVAAANGQVVANIGTLAANATATVIIQVQPPTTGSIVNSAGVVGSQPDPFPANNIVSQTVQVNNAPNTSNTNPSTIPPTVTSVTRSGYHRQATHLTIQFDQPLDPTRAADVSNYTIVPAGRRPSSTHSTITAAHYDPATNSVLLDFDRNLSLFQPYQFAIDGTSSTGITNVDGLALDGANNGQAGSNYVANISGFNVVPVPASQQKSSSERSQRTPSGTTTTRADRLKALDAALASEHQNLRVRPTRH